eukprot:TRINITY_DN10058_c0_g2_i1.p1 TRINITY_DN10058_c0_g2~~TRINITY_DN10058_c0_g2_i1.p1  ORF type:complete len:864 (+),score=158.14 TRINITY_DN10058_c0_g2_i1:274-2865(+)
MTITASASASPLWAVNSWSSQSLQTASPPSRTCTRMRASHRFKLLCQCSSLDIRKRDTLTFKDSASISSCVDELTSDERHNKQSDEGEADTSDETEEHSSADCRKPFSFGSGVKIQKAPWMSEASSIPFSKPIEKTSPKTKRVSDVVVTTEQSQGRSGNMRVERIVDRLRRLSQMEEDHTSSRYQQHQPLNNNNIEINSTANNSEFLLSRNWDSINENLEAREESIHSPLPWETSHETEHADTGKTKRVKAPTLAELTIPDEELKRLRSLGMGLKERINVNKSGFTVNLIAKIHEKWKTAELVRLKLDEPYKHNMKRAHQVAEDRTGGVVTWRAGSALILYRGQNYRPLSLEEIQARLAGNAESGKRSAEITLFVPNVSSRGMPLGQTTKSNEAESNNHDTPADGNKEAHAELKSPGVMKAEIDNLPSGVREMKQEINSILEGLGPRFIDWWGYEPLPVDADLLPEEVPNFKTPHRLLPYGVKRASLSNSELTNLRKLAKPLPTHFALGRNKRLQGLASAILKLWERCEIVKIAVKRGVQNTNNKMMTEEITKHTGGVVLLRDKYYIIIYRGKDFLPPLVATVLQEKAAEAKIHQDEEETARLKAAAAMQARSEAVSSVAGTLKESLEAHTRWKMDLEEQKRSIDAATEAKQTGAIKRLQRKLELTLKKKENAEKQLSKLEKLLAPVEQPEDVETITNEERFMFRKLGLKMKPYLLLGRRGVFDGVVENMHLHWKYRELVKIISKGNSFAAVEDIARLLENESGGILVAIERVSKGYAIIFYRGKNYQRPSTLRPKNLLNKRKALQRSVEYQRREALSFHIYQLEQNINKLVSDIKMKNGDAVEKFSEENNATLPKDSHAVPA